MLKISISGPMAVGKTTLIRKLTEFLPNSSAIYEDAHKINQSFKELSAGSPHEFALDLKQMLFLNDLYHKFMGTDSEIVFIDKGIEDYIFFWLCSYDQIESVSNDYESFIKRVYTNLAEIQSDKIIYLTAPDSILVERKESDRTRTRSFFHDYMMNFRKKELEYFQRQGAVVLETDHLSASEVFELVKKILRL